MVLELPAMFSTYHQLYPNASAFYFILLLIRRIFFAGQGVYWYILILAESCLIAGCCIRYHKERLLYTISALGLLFCFFYESQLSVMGLNQVNALFYVIFSWSNNVFMKGLPFVALGVYFSQNISKIKFSLSKLISAYSLIGLFSILFFVYCSRHDFANLNYLFLYPIQAALLFLIALQNPVAPSSAICRFSRESSAAIYFLHTIILYRIVNPIWTVFAPIPLKFITALLGSLIIYGIAKKTRIKPLCYLLSIKP